MQSDDIYFIVSARQNLRKVPHDYPQARLSFWLQKICNSHLLVIMDRKSHSYTY